MLSLLWGPVLAGLYLPLVLWKVLGNLSPCLHIAAFLEEGEKLLMFTCICLSQGAGRLKG